jgi:hypothetical protein
MDIQDPAQEALKLKVATSNDHVVNSSEEDSEDDHDASASLSLKVTA